MKRPLMFGLLGLGITGVSAYDIHFFKNQDYKQSIAIQSKFEPSAVSEVAPSPGMNMPDPEKLYSLPPISREELQRKSQHAFVPEEFSIPETADWPNRDPFSTNQRPAPVNPSKLKKAGPLSQEKLVSEDVAEPECIVTGTLIDEDRTLALINGIPLSIGARIGSWQIARIESDHIILRSGENTRRIEFTDARRQVARKEPL
jgi:hypothetical protein